MTQLPARRLLLVHAHPDDESIGNAATMARYVAEGAHVALVTCTRGEEGEIIPPGLAHLAADRDDQLGPYRATELAAAMRELGVTDHRFLGGPGRYRDSGMVGGPRNSRPGSFWTADVDEAAALLADVIRDVRPQVLVTYDPDGGYGHPDHIQAHRVALRAVDLAAGIVQKVYFNRVPRTALQEALARLDDHPDRLPFPRAGTLQDVPGVVDDDVVTTEIDGTAHAAAKAAALRAHATQVQVAPPWFALSNDIALPLSPVEYYELARGRRTDPTRRETDLFEGVAP